MIYAPQVELQIATTDSSGNVVEYDVSDDIVSGNCTLIENASHTMQITLLNNGRRYDRLFKPNDRFTLWLKRTTKLLIMTGYLDTVPFYSVWPRSITITGESTLKRLQYHYWDPGTAASVNLFNIAGQDNKSNAYNGMVSMATDLLTKVAGWDSSDIHFSAIPTGWMTKVAALWDTVAPQIGLSSSEVLAPFALASGSNAFTSGVTLSNSASDMPLAQTLDGESLPGSALPASFGTATTYQGAEDVQDVSSWYCQMQWGYQTLTGSVPPGVNASFVKNFLRSAKIMVGNPDTNQAVVVRVAGWGPPASSDAVIGLSSDAYHALDITGSSTAVNATNQMQIAWIADKDVATTPLGPYREVSAVIKTGVSEIESAASSLLSSVTGTVNKSIPLQVGNASSSRTSSPPGQPQSEAGAGAAIAAQKACEKGLPYVWGGGHGGPYPLNSPLLSGYDCSGLMDWAWNQAGIPLTGTSESQWSELSANGTVPAQKEYLLGGDLLFYAGSDGTLSSPGHVTMYIGNGQMAEAPQSGQDLHITPLDLTGEGRGGFVGVGRVTQAQNTKGTAAQGSSSSSSSSTSASAAQSFVTSFEWLTNQADPLSNSLTGYRALMNDTPFLPTVQTIINAGMRSFCSAPNGDLIAWFPDYFNVYKTLGVIQIADVELQDFTVQWSDLQMVTHQYAAGTYSPISTDSSEAGGDITAASMQTTGGVATIDFPQILESLLNLNPNDPTFSSDAIYQRFGARPNYIGLGTLYQSLAEFWYALYMFQYNWASQFAANIPISFMPELYPGMIMQVPSQNVQVYVQQVQHSWGLSSTGSGFTTSATVVAPSAIDNAGLYGFAKSGDSPA